jgi:hypothetical protein
MPIFYGKSADGSDAKVFEGVYHNEVTGRWSNVPKMVFNKEELKEQRLYDSIIKHLSKNHRSVRDEYELIIAKQSELTKCQRDYIINQIESKNTEND